MKKDVVFVFILWVVLTIIGELLVLNIQFFPVQGATEAEIVDEAFQLLFVLAVPVFSLVVAGLGYSVIRFRRQGDPTEDALPIRTSRPVTLSWFVITTALAVYVILNPGLTGLAELRGDTNPDLMVEVVAKKWEWAFSYPQYGVTIEDADELVLPVDRRVKFEITSEDIIHSFWIPTFRLKVDAVPGQFTELYATPSMVGTYDEYANFRVQCAELCGTGHTRMRTGLRIVSQNEFEDWLSAAGQ